MNAIIRAARHAWASLEEIELPTNTRPYVPSEVVVLKASIAAIGLQTPLTVIERHGRYHLVAGRHRLEALRLLNADKVPVRIVDFDDIEARLWAISENLHRAELTVAQRADHIAEWIKLTTEKVSSQVETKPQCGRPESGVSAAARELGIGKAEAHRAVKIARITPEAKEAAHEAGLDDNQSALLKVAAAPAQTQVEAVDTIAKSKAQPRLTERGQVASSPTAKPLRNLENISGGELARWLKITTPHNHAHVIRVLRTAAAILEDEANQ